MTKQKHLYREDLETFRQWLIVSGWRTELPKDPTVVLQARMTGRKYPIIVRSQGSELTFMKRDKAIVRAFLRHK